MMIQAFIHRVLLLPKLTTRVCLVIGPRNGTWSPGVPLWPNETGDLNSAYRVTLPDKTQRIFVLPAGSEPIELRVLLGSGGYSER